MRRGLGGWRGEVDRRGKRPPSLGRATTLTVLAVAMDVPTGAVRLAGQSKETGNVSNAFISGTHAEHVILVMD